MEMGKDRVHWIGFVLRDRKFHVSSSWFLRVHGNYKSAQVS